MRVSWCARETFLWDGVMRHLAFYPLMQLLISLGVAANMVNTLDRPPDVARYQIVEDALKPIGIQIPFNSVHGVPLAASTATFAAIVHNPLGTPHWRYSCPSRARRYHLCLEPQTPHRLGVCA